MEGRSLDGMRKLPEVESCLVPRSLVGWKGIETLRGLSGLKQVYLRQTKVTPEGADALRKALPYTKVWR